ncbi:MAG: HAMP domain-containing sensor histidine kinase [Lachnospiraceae bacterium]
MRYSIRKQFAYIFIGLMAGTILLCWFLNTTFLEKYYIQNKEEVLLYAYTQINQATNSGNLTSDEFDIELQKICSQYNIAVVVIDANSKTIKSSNMNTELLIAKLLDNFLKGKLQGHQYRIENAIDSRTQFEYLELWGVLDNGNLFLFRTPLAAIRDSVTIANRFLAYIGIMAVLVGAIVIYFVSKKVTEPILKLAEISSRMTNLDFEARYNGTSKTEIALLGNHMNQLSATLERTISELKTANYELQRDNEKKTQIDEMRKEFISNVSHELKTPIALIQGYAEGLQEGVNDDADSRDFYCDVIMDEANKMNTMVKKLMSLSQLESGNDTMNVERFNLSDLINNTVQSVSILTKQQKITMDLQGVIDPIYVWADEFKIEEVFRNYLSNAMNHVSGEKKIRICIEQYENTVKVFVFNTGDHIPEESLPYIWDKFYKVDKARTREYGGSGVGLSIVRAIMETMSQSYGVSNEQGGVTFWFTLDTK